MIKERERVGRITINSTHRDKRNDNRIYRRGVGVVSSAATQSSTDVASERTQYP